jgi:origin recognition complex subunit 6
MPAIRSLVKEFDFPSAAPNVFTGVESILPLLARMSAAAADTPSKRSRRTPATPLPVRRGLPNVRVLALMAVVFLYVLSKMKDIEITPKQYEEWQETAVRTLQALPAGQRIAYDELSFETSEMMPMARAEGWLQMEWFLNVVPDQDTEEMEGVEATGSPVRPAKGKSQGIKPSGSDYIGLGTMMQDATDYLGERQKQEYKTWKANVMARVQETEVI